MSDPLPGSSVLDSTAFPHIIDNILDHVALDHPAALALQTTCRAWRDKIRPSVFAHIRAAVIGLDPVTPPPAASHEPITTFYQFSTLPPPGGIAVKLPAESFRAAREWRRPPKVSYPLPASLVAAGPFIQALDIHGPIPLHVTEGLSQVAVNVTLLRCDEFFPGAAHMPIEVPPDPTYLQVRNPPHRVFYESPIALSKRGRHSAPPPTIHLDLSLSGRVLRGVQGSDLFPTFHSASTRVYMLCCPANSPSVPSEYMSFVLSIGQHRYPVTLVGFETFKPSLELHNPDAPGRWQEFIDLIVVHHPALGGYARNIKTPSFMTHDEYQRMFGRGTYQIQPPSPPT